MSSNSDPVIRQRHYPVGTGWQRQGLRMNPKEEGPVPLRIARDFWVVQGWLTVESIEVAFGINHLFLASGNWENECEWRMI